MTESQPEETMDQDLIRRILEAALLASPQPLTLAQITALFPEESLPPPGSLEQAIADLRSDTENRGVELVEVASGFRFQVKADVHSFVARLWTAIEARHSGLDRVRMVKALVRDGIGTMVGDVLAETRRRVADTAPARHRKRCG